MRFRSLVLAATCIATAVAALPAGAEAAGSPLPVSSSGGAVNVVATGLQAPTSFAFGAGQVFAGDGGIPGVSTGGVYVLRNGTATLLAGSPPSVLGLAWHDDTLYVSAHTQLLAWSGWNGTSFASQKVIYTGPSGFTGFNGIGFGANSRLYAGVTVGSIRAATTPYEYDVLSFNPAGGDLRIVATGLRQPFQLAFPAGSSEPFVSDDGLDDVAGAKPPDLVVRVHPGDSFGFPTCTWGPGSSCAGYTTPFAFFSPGSSPGGLGIIGGTLYVGLFNGIDGDGPEVASLPVTSGPEVPVLTGFAAPVVGLGTHAGTIYVGDLTGTVYSYTP